MKIQKNSYVTIHYTLTDEQGQVVDASRGQDLGESEPLGFVLGQGQIISGLEDALVDHSVGDAFKVSIEPVDAYGERNDEMVFALPRSQFEGNHDIQEGQMFQAQTPQGPHVFAVVSVSDTEVVVDGNHPMAGKKLFFDVEVMSVREATAEELQPMMDDVSEGCSSGGCSSCSGCH